MKNFKKVLSLILALVFAIGTVGIVNADMTFSDLSASHWGYSYIQTLVGDGTINGYQDGTFRPEANVTRAEFVKMIGKTTKAYETPFEDIAGHWGYDYIMYSDMDVEGTMFYPDVAITRDDVIGLLWKRAGSPKASAPSIITNQSAKSDAVAWAYAYGIMNGDDGITLRLEDGVTRAEAAALICRSRTISADSEKKSFVKTVNPDILEIVYEALDLFDDEYNSSRTFTNGEIAAAAMRLAHDTKTPRYTNLNTDYSVDRPYTFAFYTACKYVWGKDKMTESFYDETANNLDTVALLTFAANYKSYLFNINSTAGSLYTDVTSVSNNDMKFYVSGAYEKGIKLDNTDNIYPNNTMTAENLALILLQLDSMAGLSSVNYSLISGSGTSDIPMKTEIAKYPTNYEKYPVILSVVPNECYDSAFIDSNGVVRSESPKDMYELARSRSDIFINFMRNIGSGLNTLGSETALVLVPSMIIETDSEYVMKIRVRIDGVQDGKTFDDVFPNNISGTKPELKKGLMFYATLATGAKIQGTQLPIDDAVFTSIDYIY